MKKQGIGGVKSALGKVFAYMRGSKVAVFAALVLAALGAMLTLVGPNRIGEITNLMAEGLVGTIDMNAIARIGIALAIIYVLSAGFTFIQHYIMATVTLKTAKRLRGDLAEKINRVPLKVFNATTQGDVLSRITNDVSTLQQGLSNSLPAIISAGAQFLGCMIMMFATQWRLALCVVGITLGGAALLMTIMKRSQRYFVARQESLGELNGYVEEMYTGHEVVRISRAEEQVKDKFTRLNQAVYDANWRSQFFSGIMQPLMTVVGNIAYVAVCVVGAALAIHQVIRFGTIVSFILYVRLFTSPLSQIAQGMTNMQTASASALRIFDFLQTPELEDERHKPQKVSHVRGQVVFDHVRFSYPEAPDKVIIKDFSAVIQPGQKVAIVGPTGAGKTTMVHLLMRFYDPQQGAISIDGTPIDQLSRKAVHGMFGMVLQDTWLFEGTVRENLMYNLRGVTDEQLERVCQVCGVDQFVHTLPEGFDTVLSESTTISAGQKQLFTIARAMLQNNPMLILDEATSSVDTRTELLIQRAMDALTQGRTSFVIAHRLSTIKNADIILVMQEGDVVETGTHEQLLEKQGVYAELYNSQFAQE